jgi:hypothetical protein
LKLISQYDEGNHILELKDAKITYNGNISELKQFQNSEIEETWKKLGELASQINVEDPMASKDAYLYDSMSIKQWLDENVKDENTKKFVQWFIGVCCTSEAHEVSFLFFLIFIKSSGGYENV